MLFIIGAGAQVYGIRRGYFGMMTNDIYELESRAVGGIIRSGGTILFSARCDEFRTAEGQDRALNVLRGWGIEGLVVVGGDGSLRGAARIHELGFPVICIPASIDNDIPETEMAIGVDTALNTILDAMDKIKDTASAHQRAFIIEVMGRHCGYLTLMAGLATGANWILIPENPPSEDDWEETMCETLRASRKTGRRHNIVLVAEGARDQNGKPITSDQVRLILLERLGENARVTILGHVQRGGSPSVFDRNMSTVLGYSAVNEILSAVPGSEPQLIGIRGHEVVNSSLM